MRDLPRPRRAARRGPGGDEAARAARPQVLPRLPRLRSVAADGLPADQPDGAQPAQALHLVPQPARSDAATHPGRVLGVPRADRADQGGLEPRAAPLHDVPPARPSSTSARRARRCRPSPRRASSAATCHGEGARRPRLGRTRRRSTCRPTAGATCCWQCHYPHLPEGRGMNKRDFLKGMILFFPAGGLLTRCSRGRGEGGRRRASAEPRRPTATTDPTSTTTAWGSTSTSASAAAGAWRPARPRTTCPASPSTSAPGSSATSIRRGRRGRRSRASASADARRSTAVEKREVVRSFFVPKLCNQCDAPALRAGLPGGRHLHDRGRRRPGGQASAASAAGYCIQACPYGARYLHPAHQGPPTSARSATTGSCRGLLPACVEVCPTQARIFGDLQEPARARSPASCG